MLLTNVHSLMYIQIDCFAFFFRHTLTPLYMCSVFKARQYILYEVKNEFGIRDWISVVGAKVLVAAL